MLFGAERLKHFPEAWLRAGCFEGADKSVILDSANLTNYPVLAVEEAIRFVQRNTRRALEVKGVRHREVWEFPVVALREAITNAFVHADYAQRGSPIRLAIFRDRIEIENPGNLPPGLTVEDIRRGVSKLRNRVIGRVFHELGLSEQWGSGIQRMTAACRAAGLPEPELEEIGSSFRVTFRRASVAKPERDKLDTAIVELLRHANPAQAPRRTRPACRHRQQHPGPAQGVSLEAGRVRSPAPEHGVHAASTSARQSALEFSKRRSTLVR